MRKAAKEGAWMEPLAGERASRWENFQEEEEEEEEETSARACRGDRLG